MRKIKNTNDGFKFPFHTLEKYAARSCHPSVFVRKPNVDTTGQPVVCAIVAKKNYGSRRQIGNRKRTRETAETFMRPAIN